MFCPKCGKQNQDTSRFCKNCGKPLPVRVPTPQPLISQMPPSGSLLGKVLEGRYEIQAKLGEGGMGEVYKAKRLLIGDCVAIKLLHTHLASNTQAAERFRREAQTAIKLKHRNIITLFDVGISQVHNAPYLLMELAEGLTLRQVIRQNGTLPLQFAVTVTTQICSALDEAHRLGIIHRDIKPENVIVNQTGGGWHIKILDFGIAKLYNEADIGLTLDGTSMGTPQYMSPEQCLGRDLDGRSDLYSAAIVVYEMLSGTVPFKSPPPSAIVFHQVQTPPPPPRSVNPNIPPQVEAVIMRALEKQREMRQPNAGAFAQELIQAATAAMRESAATEQPAPVAQESAAEAESPAEAVAFFEDDKAVTACDPPDEKDIPEGEEPGDNEQSIEREISEETVPETEIEDKDDAAEPAVEEDPEEGSLSESAQLKQQ